MNLCAAGKNSDGMEVQQLTTQTTGKVVECYAEADMGVSVAGVFGQSHAGLGLGS